MHFQNVNERRTLVRCLNFESVVTQQFLKITQEVPEGSMGTMLTLMSTMGVPAVGSRKRDGRIPHRLAQPRECYTLPRESPFKKVPLIILRFCYILEVRR